MVFVFSNSNGFYSLDVILEEWSIQTIDENGKSEKRYNESFSV